MAVSRVLACLPFLLLTAAPARAQIGGGGSIQGTVVDVSKAALPGAVVTATNQATGIATARQTTGAGVYALTPLPQTSETGLDGVLAVYRGIEDRDGEA